MFLYYILIFIKYSKKNINDKNIRFIKNFDKININILSFEYIYN